MIDWQKRWNALNTRQQTYLKIIYDIDYKNEQYYRHRWNPQRQGYPPPASQWRWIPYDGGQDGYRDTPLRRQLGNEGLVDQGTGSTFESLEEHKLIERKYEGHDDEALLFVQMTRTGRTLIRKNLDVPQPPPRLAKGQLREWNWRALATAYRYVPKGVPRKDRRYGNIENGAWKRLQSYQPWALVYEAYNKTDGHRMKITQEGIDYYEAQWSTYQPLYPNVVADKPSNKKLPPVIKTGGTPYDLIKVAKAVTAKRNKRGLRDTVNEIGISSPSLLARIERAKPTTPEIYSAIFNWLGVSDEDFLATSSESNLANSGS